MRLAKIIPGRGKYRHKHSLAVGDGKPGVSFGVIKDFNSFFNERQKILKGLPQKIL